MVAIVAILGGRLGGLRLKGFIRSERDDAMSENRGGGDEGVTKAASMSPLWNERAGGTKGLLKPFRRGLKGVEMFGIIRGTDLGLPLGLPRRL